MASGVGIGKVEGLAEVNRALDTLEDDLTKEITQGMRSEADAIAGAIRSAMPSGPALSGMGDIWTGDVYVAPYSGRKSGDETKIYRIGLGGYGKAMADIAGAGGGGSSISGRNMSTALAGKYGAASRWAWPAANSHTNRITSRAAQSADNVMDDVTRRLGQ